MGHNTEAGRSVMVNMPVLGTGDSRFESGRPDQLKQTNPDIILLDVLMPRMNGFIFLEKIKQDKNLKNIPVIIFSNYTTTEYVKKGLSLGAVAFIRKTSITLNELINKINGYLKNRVERQ